MSPDHNNHHHNHHHHLKDEKPRSTTSNRKTTSTTKPNQDQESQLVALKCPRCDSPNTKFCYYNNYSLSQPRHFCKTCRRYWTRNGALRNVPIGGGCRKNKKLLKSSSSSSSANNTSSSSLRFNSKDHSSTTSTGLKFFDGLSPAMDFQLGGLINSPPNSFNHFVSSFNDHHIQSYNPPHPQPPQVAPLMGFHHHQELGSTSTMATTIESLSTMNQDLHWKLQQQRLSNMFFHQKENGSTSTSNYVIPEPKPLQPILFQNLENTSKQDQENQLNLSTEWYFDNSYAGASMNPTPETSSSNTGIQAWGDLSNYNALP